MLRAVQLNGMSNMSMKCLIYLLYVFYVKYLLARRISLKHLMTQLCHF